MAQAMTASRTTVYQNNSYPSSSSASADMHHHNPNSWHPPPSHLHPLQTHHIPSASSTTLHNGTATATANRIPPTSSSAVTNGLHIPTGPAAVPTQRSRNKADFYKNGRPAEVIVIDSESPEPSTATKRKRHDSISASTTVSVVNTKRPRTSHNEAHEISTRVSQRHKSHSVTWVRDPRGIYRAQHVIVP